MTELLMQRLFAWWTSPQTEQAASLFDANLIYDRGFGGLDGKDWVWLVEQAPPWSELRVIDSIACENKAALVFEGIEGATVLRHRIAWLIEVRDGKVAKVIETSSIVP